MSQATDDVTARPGCGCPRSPFLCEGSPDGTLTNCRDVVRFLGLRMGSWESTGVDFSSDDGNAVSLILDAVGMALDWEAKRVHYQRKSEAQVSQEEHAHG